MDKKDQLTIGQIAERADLAVSAVRFYEDEGLVRATRSEAGHRTFERGELRRITFISVCQSLGYTLAEIATALESLPAGRTPTEKDWQRLAVKFSADLDQRIKALVVLQEKLSGCIGCGCLSMTECELYNSDDQIRSQGPGARVLKIESRP